MRCCICRNEDHASHLRGGSDIGVYGPVHDRCATALKKAKRRSERAASKQRRRVDRARHSATVRRQTVHLRARVRPFIACGPDGARRVDQDHAITMDPLLVNCPGCKATPAYSAALAAAQGV